MSGAAKPADQPQPGRAARAGLVGAFGVLLAVLAAIRLGLEDPWWAAMSAWIISNPDRRQLLSKGVQRVVGTIAGAIVSYVAAGIAAGLPVLQAILLFVAGAVGTRQRLAAVRFSFGWFYAAITAALVLMQSLTAPDDLEAFARARCLEIICGVVAVMLVDAVLGAPPGEAAAAAAPPPADVARVAVVGGLLLVLVPLLWSLLALPAGVQMAISALVLVDHDVGSQRVRAAQRVLGCAAGGGLGLGLLAFGLDVFPIWVAALGGGLFVFSRLHHGGGPQAYVGTQGGVALIMALVVGSGPPDTLLPVLNRLAGILLGVGLVVGLGVVFARPRAQPVA